MPTKPDRKFPPIPTSEEREIWWFGRCGRNKRDSQYARMRKRDRKIELWWTGDGGHWSEYLTESRPFICKPTMPELKLTPDEWLKKDEYYGLVILDPDGWDRSNFEASWKEPITKDEFDRRWGESTCRIPRRIVVKALQAI